MEQKPHKQHTEMEQEHFCPTGNQGVERTSSQQLQGSRASGCHRHPPYGTAKSEEAQYPFQKDTNRKRCLTSSKKSSLLF